MHLVGDITQPLHCADRNGDRGGNKQLCFMPDSKARKATNLHSVWHTTILGRLIGKKNITDFADELNERIKPDDAKAWAGGSTIDWANEGMHVAAASVYPGVKAGTAPYLTRSYVDQAEPVIEKQLERGGVRLAAVLNKAFASGATTRAVVAK